MDNVDHLGPNADIVDQDRRKFMTRILVALRAHEEANGFRQGTCNFPSATWFSLWLSDLCRLEKIAAEFEDDARLAWARNKKIDSFQLVTMWLPTSGITPKLPSIRESSHPTSAVPSASPSAPNTPTTTRITQMPTGLVGTPVESSPAGPSPLGPSPLQESSAVSPARKRRKIAGSPVVPGTPSDYSRDPIFHKNCVDRDYVCGITKNTYALESAHVCPFSLTKHRHSSTDRFFDFQSSLSLFWSKEKIQKWLHSIATLAETTANGITLQPAVHKYWDKALFALRFMSVNNEKTEMRLKFYWLKPVLPLAQGSTSLLPEHITEDYMVEPPLLADGLEAGGRDHHESVPEAVLMILNCQTRKIVCSGDEIIITTPDPIHLPLPDKELLGLQWTLHRRAALCAAAGFFVDSFYEDDDFDAGAPCVLTRQDVCEEVDDDCRLSKHLWEAMIRTPPLRVD